MPFQENFVLRQNVLLFKIKASSLTSSLQALCASLCKSMSYTLHNGDWKCQYLVRSPNLHAVISSLVLCYLLIVLIVCNTLLVQLVILARSASTISSIVSTTSMCNRCFLLIFITQVTNLRCLLMMGVVIIMNLLVLVDAVLKINIIYVSNGPAIINTE